jgi:hypothetical protein
VEDLSDGVVVLLCAVVDPLRAAEDLSGMMAGHLDTTSMGAVGHLDAVVGLRLEAAANRGGKRGRLMGRSLSRGLGWRMRTGTRWTRRTRYEAVVCD